MYTFLVRRIVATIPVFGMVALFVLFMLRLASGDPAAILAGDNGTPEQIAEIRAALGFDKPIYVQLMTASEMPRRSRHLVLQETGHRADRLARRTDRHAGPDDLADHHCAGRADGRGRRV